MHPSRRCDICGGLSAFDDEGFHNPSRGEHMHLQGCSPAPMHSIVSAVREQNFVGRGVLRDRELDHLTCDPSIRRYSGQRRVELTRVTNFPSLPMRQIFYINIHVKGFICPAHLCRTKCLMNYENPIADVMSGCGRRCERDSHIHALSGSHITGDLHGGAAHLSAAIKDYIIVWCPGACAAVLQTPCFGKHFTRRKLSPIGDGHILDEVAQSQ